LGIDLSFKIKKRLVLAKESRLLHSNAVFKQKTHSFALKRLILLKESLLLHSNAVFKQKTHIFA
jgi:hypothetical protein